MGPLRLRFPERRRNGVTDIATAQGQRSARADTAASRHLGPVVGRSDPPQSMIAGAAYRAIRPKRNGAK